MQRTMTGEFRDAAGRNLGNPTPGSGVRRSLNLVRVGHPDRPGFDTAVSRALLMRVSSGEVGETLRLHAPARIVAFGKQDAVAPGYPSAVAAARDAGFAAVLRLAGGRAAVFHPGTIAFAWTIPDPYPPDGIRSRFREISELIRSVLTGLGIDARVGEVPGEYCPGEFSVNAGGTLKLAGIGQRLVRRAAHVGGVIVVAGSDDVRNVLVPVYGKLGLGWKPATAGAVEDVAPGVDVPMVMDALVAEVTRRHELTQGSLDPPTLDVAETLLSDHLVGTAVGAGAGSE